MKKLLVITGVLVGLSLVASAQQTTLEVVNETDATLYFLYISPEDATSWGLDWLGDRVLPTGDSIVLTVRSASGYDVRAIDENEREVVLWGWQPNGAQLLRLRMDSSEQPATDRASIDWLEVVNDTNYEIVGMYVTEPGGWSESANNLLGDSRLRVAERYRVRLAPEALPSLVVDVVLVDVDGDRYLRRQIDLETVTELRFTLSDLAFE